jgi:hypothetical protein
LATAGCDRSLQRFKRSNNSLHIGLTGEALTLISELAKSAMTAFVIASLAGSNLVLNPTRATLDARNEVFCGWNDVAIIEWSAAPDTVVTVTPKNDCHSLAAVWLPTAMLFCR